MIGPVDSPVTPSGGNGAVLDVVGLTTWFASPRGSVRAVTDVDLSIQAGELFALVGESGCGKSVLARSILRLHPERSLARSSGSVQFDGTDLRALEEQALSQVRGRRIGLVLQDPSTALNPVLTIGQQLGLILRRHTSLGRRERRRRVVELLDRVGIPAAASRVDDHPGQMSGGMRQRVVIAAALSCDPALLIADEPTTALDVTVQASILELIDGLRRDSQLAVLFITHDLGIVAERADSVAVMYAGRIVERTSTSQLFGAPSMPYTRALLGSIPQLAIESGHDRLRGITGSPPDLVESDDDACAFADRCEQVAANPCRLTRPQLREIRPGHEVACHLVAEVDHVR